MTISETIKSIRKKAELSQAAFAKSLEISTASVTAYESGRMKPSQKVMEKIRDIYGVDVEAETAEEPAPKKSGRKPADEKAAAGKEEKTGKEKTAGKKGKAKAPEADAEKPAEAEAPVEAEKPAEPVETVKEAGRKRGKKPAAKQPVVAIQSVMGGSITIEEILAKVKAVAPDAAEIYVKPEENKAYYIGEGVDGFVLIWD